MVFATRSFLFTGALCVSRGFRTADWVWPPVRAAQRRPREVVGAVPLDGSLPVTRERSRGLPLRVACPAMSRSQHVCVFPRGGWYVSLVRRREYLSQVHVEAFDCTWPWPLTLFCGKYRSGRCDDWDQSRSRFGGGGWWGVVGRVRYLRTVSGPRVPTTTQPSVRLSATSAHIPRMAAQARHSHSVPPRHDAFI